MKPRLSMALASFMAGLGILTLTNAQTVDGSANQTPAPTPKLSGEVFDQLWDVFDKKYAMFVLRPEVDWTRLREQYRSKALTSKSAFELAGVCAEMLKNPRDLHIWLTVADTSVPVFNRPFSRLVY